MFAKTYLITSNSFLYIFREPSMFLPIIGSRIRPITLALSTARRASQVTACPSKVCPFSSPTTRPNFSVAARFNSLAAASTSYTRPTRLPSLSCLFFLSPGFLQVSVYIYLQCWRGDILLSHYSPAADALTGQYRTLFQIFKVSCGCGSTGCSSSSRTEAVPMF